MRACQLLNIYVACARQECVNRFWIRFGLVPDSLVFFGGRSCTFTLPARDKSALIASGSVLVWPPNLRVLVENSCPINLVSCF